MEGKTPKSNRRSVGFQTRDGERLASPVSALPLAPRLSESQIGGNYMLQMENLLPEDFIASDDDRGDGNQLHGATVSPGSSLPGFLTPLLGQDSSQSLGARARPYYPTRRARHLGAPSGSGPSASNTGTPASTSFSQSLSPKNNSWLPHTAMSSGGGLRWSSRNTPSESRDYGASSRSTVISKEAIDGASRPVQLILSGCQPSSAAAPVAARATAALMPPRASSTRGAPSSAVSPFEQPASSLSQSSHLGQILPSAPDTRVANRCPAANRFGDGLSYDPDACVGAPLAGSQDGVAEGLPDFAPPTDQHTVASGKTWPLNALMGANSSSPTDSPGQSRVTHTANAARRSVPLQVPTIIVTAVVMILGVLSVAIVGFTPMYIGGFREVDHAFSALHTLATSGIITASSTPIHQLPQLTATILARFSTLEIEGKRRLQLAPEEALFSLANVFSSSALRDFLELMQFVDTTPGDEWRALVSSHAENGSLAGMVQTATESPNQATMYHLDPSTFYRNLEREYTSVNLSMHNAIFGNTHVFHRVIVPWNKTHDPLKNPSLKALWTTSKARDYASLLDFVVPLRMAGGNLGYLESMLRSSSIMRLVNAHLFRALRANGRYFVVDPLLNAILANSWNESLSCESDGGMRYSCLPVDNVSDPLAAAAVKQLLLMGHLGPPETIKAKQGMREKAKFRFNRDTAWVQVYNYASTRSIGLNLVFAVVTLESDRFSSVYQVRTAMVCAMVVIVCAIAVCAYLSASYVVCSLTKLIEDLQSNKNLLFDTDSEAANSGGLSVFTELLHVQLAYAQLQRRLIAFKTFLPGPLLIPTAEFVESSASDKALVSPGAASLRYQSEHAFSNASGGGALTFGASASSLLTLGGGGVLGLGSPGGYLRLDTAISGAGDIAARAVETLSNPTGRRTPTSGNNVSVSRSEIVTALIPRNPQGSLDENLRISRKWRQDMRLNTKIFNEQVNVFQRRYCTVLFVCRYYTQEVDYGSLNRYFTACYAAAAEYNGCMEFLRPDYAVCTFGAHTPMPMHATRAAQCALAINNKIPPNEREKVNCVLDSNEFLVGTCGARHGKKGRVVFDVMHMIALVRACRTLDYGGVIATQSAASRLPDYQSIPVNCVYEQTFQSPLVICEIRELTEGTNIVQLSQTARRFREAFHYMSKGRYRKALHVYRKIGPNDPTAVRLANTCKQHIKEKDKCGFLTVLAQPRMNLLSQVLGNKNLAPFMRMQRQYIFQLLGDSMLFRPGHAPPLKVAQGIAESTDDSLSAAEEEDNRRPHEKQERDASFSALHRSSGDRASVGREGKSSKQRKLLISEKQAAFFRVKERGGVPHNIGQDSVSSRRATPQSSCVPVAEIGFSGSPSGAAAFRPSGEMESLLSRSAKEHSSNTKHQEVHVEEGGNVDNRANTTTEATTVVDDCAASTSDAPPKSVDRNDEDDALFEWIEVTSDGSSQAAQNTGGAAALGYSSASTMHGNGESLVFVDDSGRRWSRSLKAIGDGAFSVVYLGMSEDGVQVAIKCIPLRRRDINEDNVRGEMRMMAELRHPNIVEYVGFCSTKTHLSIIMEYVPGGSLFAFTRNFGKLDVPIARRFLLDVLSGLSYLHARNIVHCDVKPHNMLIGMDGICKLSDFGSTASDATDCAKSDAEMLLRGTALYMAPEVAHGERCTPQSDIYSLGVSLLEMLLGQPPWQWSSTAPPSTTQTPLPTYYRNDARFVQLLSRGYVTPHIPESLSEEVYGFCQACCQTDPRKRPTAKELMSFPFIL